MCGPVHLLIYFKDIDRVRTSGKKYACKSEYLSGSHCAIWPPNVDNITHCCNAQKYTGIAPNESTCPQVYAPTNFLCLSHDDLIGNKTKVSLFSLLVWLGRIYELFSFIFRFVCATNSKYSVKHSAILRKTLNSNYLTISIIYRTLLKFELVQRMCS